MVLEHADMHRLFMYTLYEKPVDYPDYYVVRKSFCVRGKIVAWLSHPTDIILEDNIDVIHARMRRAGFTFIIRQIGDVPTIMGVYI